MDSIEKFVSREEHKRLLEYSNLLLKWNKAMNLISFKTVNDILYRHILDSLQLLKFISDKNISLVDVGSGAGFPAIVLSICGISEVTLIESDSRKVAFLLQASDLSPGVIRIENNRVENLSLECDILTARAFSNLDSIFDY
ncbi:16S rRNA (guanine(527)-N(7))-methyltransferase RsmG, partial [Rickettsiaceae bacterium]|nr:16S rRNA (guanine(527)-N(7))-methyltransferase RsmG [Rickettsiaceae bacterium]